MKAPAFAGSVDNVERLGVLKIQMLDLPLKRVGRVGREQFALDGAEDRKSGPSERVLDFTARVRFHVVLHLIAAERIGFYRSCAAGARSGALRMSVSAPRAISSITSCMTDKTSWTKPRRASASPSLYLGGFYRGTCLNWRHPSEELASCTRRGMAADAWVAITDHLGPGTGGAGSHVGLGRDSLTHGVHSPVEPTASAV